MAGNAAIAVSAVVTAVALFAVGLGLSLFTGRDALRSALRMVLIGGGAGTLSFLVGRAFGVAHLLSPAGRSRQVLEKPAAAPRLASKARYRACPAIALKIRQ